MMTGTDDYFRRQWAIQDNPGRIFAAALARLIEAYESSPDRARHALSWEHLLGRDGSPNPTTGRDEASAGKSSDSAKQAIQTSMLHGGEAPLSEYSQLLDDWYVISSRADEESFKLDEYLWHHHTNWEVTGEGLTPTEKRRIHGWNMEDLELLRSRDPEILSEYRQELEKEAAQYAERGQNYTETEVNRKIWIEARLADIDSAVESKILDARMNDLGVQISRWKQIEHMRTHSENWGRLRLWAEIPEDARPESPTPDKREFPDHLSPEMKNLYESVVQKQNQVWRTLSRENVDEYETLVDQLLALSKELPTTPGLAGEMARREKERAEGYRGGPRVPISTDFGWYEYCSLDMDDEANLDWEIEDEVRRNGNLYIHWAKELIGMLPAITKRAVELSKHSISDIPKDRVPESLSVLFEQAHLCYLFNLEIPCAMTCGSLIEEAIEVKFPQLRDKWEGKRANDGKQVGWKLKRMDVLEIYPHFENVSRKANDVIYLRNDAVHKPETFLRDHQGKQASILRSTRDVLENLFEAEEYDEDRKTP